MRTITADALPAILAAHRAWVFGQGGSRAVLRDAVLRDAVLRDAVLTGADLTGAVMPDGGPWTSWADEVALPLLRASGTDLALVLTPGVWACHSWGNCPLRAAWGVTSTAELPRIWRGHGALFVQLFDAGLIPLAPLRAATGLPELEPVA